jgi:hypothetical protein
MGLGSSVRLVIFELHDCASAAASSISFARVAFRFGQCQMAHRGHYLVSRRACIGKQATERLP